MAHYAKITPNFFSKKDSPCFLYTPKGSKKITSRRP